MWDDLRVAAVSFWPKKFDVEHNARTLEQLFRQATTSTSAPHQQVLQDGLVTRSCNVSIFLGLELVPGLLDGNAATELVSWVEQVASMSTTGSHLRNLNQPWHHFEQGSERGGRTGTHPDRELRAHPCRAVGAADEAQKRGGRCGLAGAPTTRGHLQGKGAPRCPGGACADDCWTHPPFPPLSAPTQED